MPSSADCAQSLSCIQLFVTLGTVAHQDSLSMIFSRQEYWSVLPFRNPENILNPGISTPISYISREILNHWVTWEDHFADSGSSVAQSCLTLCDPMECSTPGFPVHHQLPESTQTHVHWVSDAIQPPYPLTSPSPPAFNLSQHQGLFQWVSFSIRWPNTEASASASILPMNIQDCSPLGLTGWISLLSKGLSRVFSNTTVQKHQFFGTQLSLSFNSHIHTWLLEKPKLWLDGSLLAK